MSKPQKKGTLISHSSKCLRGEAVSVGCSVRLHDQDEDREQAGEGGDQGILQNQVDGDVAVGIMFPL